MSRLLTPPDSIFRTLQGDVLRTTMSLNLAVTFSALLLDHNVASVSSFSFLAPSFHRPVLHLGVLDLNLLLACPLSFLMSCGSIFTNLQGDVSRTQTIPPCLRFWRERPHLAISRTPTRLISQSPPRSKRRSCAAGVKRCKRQAYLTDYVAQVSQFEPLPISAAPRQTMGMLD